MEDKKQKALNLFYIKGKKSSDLEVKEQFSYLVGVSSAWLETGKQLHWNLTLHSFFLSIVVSMF